MQKFKVSIKTKMAVVINIFLALAMSLALVLVGLLVKSLALTIIGILFLGGDIYFMYMCWSILFGYRNNTWPYIFSALLFASFLGGLITWFVKFDQEFIERSRKFKKIAQNVK